MTKKVSKTQQELLDELVGGSEIAEICGASRGLVSMWQKREDFPAPLVTLAAGRFYRRSDVLDWFNAR